MKQWAVKARNGTGYITGQRTRLPLVGSPLGIKLGCNEGTELGLDLGALLSSELGSVFGIRLGS